MRIRFAVLPIILTFFSLPLLAQSYMFGGSVGLGTNWTDSFDESEHTFDSTEFFGGWFLDDETILQLRYESMSPGGDKGTMSPDFDILAVTVDYIFSDKVFNTGFFMGPIYYDGTVSWAVPLTTLRATEDDDGLGLVGGVESFIPLSRRVDLYLNLKFYYLPLDRDTQFLASVNGGLSIKF